MKKLYISFSVLIFIILIIQLIPVDRSNPDETHAVVWDSIETLSLFHNACADCHSNRTNWPWYSYVAPISFFVVGHVNEGRSKFNVSDGTLDEAHESYEAVEKGFMPLKSYLWFHPEAELGENEKQKLINGLKKTFSKDRE